MAACLQFCISITLVGKHIKRLRRLGVALFTTLLPPCCHGALFPPTLAHRRCASCLAYDSVASGHSVYAVVGNHLRQRAAGEK